MNQRFPLMTVEHGSPAHRTWQTIWWGLFALVVVIAPYVLPAFRVSQVNRAIYFAVAILGLNLVIGYSGLIALGHSAFVGLGAFVTATLIQDEGWDHWMTILPVLLVSFGVGLLLGIPSLRIKGLYLALVTVAFAAVFPSLLKIDKWGISERTGGANGRKISERVEAPGWLDWLLRIDNDRHHIYRYWMVVLIAAGAFLLTRNIIRSRAGRAIIAIRDNETAAAVSGVNLRLYKTVTFGISAMLGGVAGTMFVIDKSFVQEADFGFRLAIFLLAGLVVGGVGTLSGAIPGGLLVVFIPHWAQGVRVNLWIINIDEGGPSGAAIFGLILVLVAFFARGGLVGFTRRFRALIIRVVPLPPDGSHLISQAAAEPPPDADQEIEQLPVG